MKFLAPALIFCGAATFGQTPQVPHKMQFAGMTLTIRDDARREIQKDVDALRQSPRHFNIKVERAKTYFPIIEQIFAEEQLPDEFKYLSLQESALISDAVSTSNAVGYWQFLDFAGRDFGLRIDNEVDERMNIVSSSRAAAKMLKKNNHYFNNWVHALQAYQMGAGGAMRALGDKDMGSRKMEINGDTYWYVKKYLAHKVAFEDAVGGKPQLEVVTFYTSGGKSAGEIASEVSVDESRLREFNKWLKGPTVPMDKDYAFLVPRGEAVIDFTVLASAPKAKTVSTPKPVESLEVNGVQAIRAAKGETLESLSKRSNLSLKKFLHYNEMTIDQPVLAGQIYFIEKKKKKASRELYTVQPGESLWLVSQRFGVQQKALIRYNKLQSGARLSGYTLYMRSGSPAAQVDFDGQVALLDESEAFNWESAKANRSEKKSVVEIDRRTSSEENEELQPVNKTRDDITVHEVSATDTLYSVARQYGVTIKELMDWNGKKDFSVSLGEKLKVKSH